jgi:putative endonuclease
MYSIYILYSETAERHYVGYTSDIERRLSEHNDVKESKKKMYTHKNGPWKLVYKEDGFVTRSEAMKREKYLKGSRGRQKVKAILSDQSDPVGIVRPFGTD